MQTKNATRYIGNKCFMKRTFAARYCDKEASECCRHVVIVTCSMHIACSYCIGHVPILDHWLNERPTFITSPL